jgi:aryl-alcohol dehydrogenase-like predicted oxidoreductase
VATLRRGLDAGINVIDTAPSYEEGYSEEIVGRTLQGRREGVFLIDKIDHVDQPVAEQVAGSLSRLGLDHADAFVFHGVSTPEDWDAIAAPGGGFDQLAEEVAAGRTRFIGISSHHPDVLDLALRDGRCDLLMFPVGPFVHPRYVKDILPRARTAGVGTVCFKTFGAGKLLGDTSGYNQPLQNRPRGKLSSGGMAAEAPTLPCLTVEDCLHYTLTLDPDVALLGLSFPNEQDAAFAAFSAFRSLDSEALEDIRLRGLAAVAGKGPVWWNPPAEL